MTDPAAPIAALLMSGDPEQVAQAAELLRAVPELRAPAEATILSRVDGLAELVAVGRAAAERQRLQSRFALSAAARAARRLSESDRGRVQNMLLAAELFVAGEMSRQEFYRQFPPHRILPPTPGLDALWGVTLSAIGASWQVLSPEEVAERYRSIAAEQAHAHARAVCEADDALLRLPRRRRQGRVEALARAAAELAVSEEAAAQQAELERLAAEAVAVLLGERDGLR